MTNYLENDIKAAINIINGNYQTIDRKIYRPIYPWTNERIDQYIADYNLEEKKVLTITSSFDHALHSINHGAKSIDCFDINRLCKYYADLKQALILRYDKDLVNKILNFTQNNEDLSHYKINPYFSLEDIKDLFIMPESYIFWSVIINNPAFNKNNYRLFRNDGNPTNKLPPLLELKEQLKTTSINFFDFDIENINTYLDDSHKYDIVFLSNILDFYKEDTEIINIIMNKLNDNGLIFDYHIKKRNRTHSLEAIKTIECSNKGNQICKIYQKMY